MSGTFASALPPLEPTTNSANSSVQFDAIGPDNLDRLRPLWKQLHRHHQSIAPHLGPFVSDAQSWRLRQMQYRDAFATGAFGWIARAGQRDIGYILCARRQMQWDATFVLPPMLWELLTLFVTDDRRGSGLGSCMLRCLALNAMASDAPTQLIGVIPDNLRAIALYQHNGFRPTWLTLTRFCRAPEHGSRRPVFNGHIEKSTPDSVQDLRPLWLDLHAQHQRTSLNFAPFVDDVSSWNIIEKTWQVHAEAGHLWTAIENGEVIGMASAHVYDVGELPNFADTWATGTKIAEIKYMSVADGFRGRGIGSALLDHIDRDMDANGVKDQLVGAIATNAGAIRFYQKRGFRASWLELLNPIT